MPDPCQLLQPEAVVSRVGWYATPLALETAAELQAQARQVLQRTLVQGGYALAPRLAEMIAGFWLGRDVSHDYRSLVATVPETQQAAVELVFGQLLMSRKRAGALHHLNRGFELATATLAPAVYFILLRRHTLLRNLVLTATGSLAQTLPDLLQEARVIQRLQRGHGLPRTLRNPHDDTLG
ncbi:MAG: hypothetical protein HY941_04840 [Gammaproteobacteria bacterium]|nr:hypothetical protein [Gammaproteobacteria bacterium]